MTNPAFSLNLAEFTGKNCAARLASLWQGFVARRITRGSLERGVGGCSTPQNIPTKIREESNYLKAYDAGMLDPAFSKLGGTGWDYRFVFPDGYTLEDIDWVRNMIRNYRPDHTRDEYKWRYCRIVKTDVPYVGGVDRSGMPGDLSNIQQFFLEGGICGPRAFVGQLSCYAFGIPARRAPSTGHAAMARWTPDGWTTVLGPHFAFCSVNGLTGLEFLLLSQCHKEPEPYKQVLNCEWLGNALGEDGVTGYGSGGGFWKLLAFCRKLALVEDAAIKDIGVTGAELAESNVEAAAEKVDQIELTDAQKTIVTGAESRWRGNTDWYLSKSSSRAPLKGEDSGNAASIVSPTSIAAAAGRPWPA